MLRLVLALTGLSLLVGCAGPSATSASATAAWATPAAGGWVFQPTALDEDEDGEEDEGSKVAAGGGVLWGIAMYIPNRVFDVLDIVRARVRLGPGVAIGVRATEYADLFAGTYATVYAGLPGPRNRKIPRLPVGVESKTGLEASVADLTVEGPIGPDYGPGRVRRQRAAPAGGRGRGHRAGGDPGPGVGVRDGRHQGRRLLRPPEDSPWRRCWLLGRSSTWH